MHQASSTRLTETVVHYIVSSGILHLYQWFLLGIFRGHLRPCTESIPGLGQNCIRPCHIGPGPLLNEKDLALSTYNFSDWWFLPQLLFYLQLHVRHRPHLKKSYQNYFMISFQHNVISLMTGNCIWDQTYPTAIICRNSLTSTEATWASGKLWDCMQMHLQLESHVQMLMSVLCNDTILYFLYMSRHLFLYRHIKSFHNV